MMWDHLGYGERAPFTSQRGSSASSSAVSPLTRNEAGLCWTPGAGGTQHSAPPMRLDIRVRGPSRRDSAASLTPPPSYASGSTSGRQKLRVNTANLANGSGASSASSFYTPAGKPYLTPGSDSAKSTISPLSMPRSRSNPVSSRQSVSASSQASAFSGPNVK